MDFIQPVTHDDIVSITRDVDNALLYWVVKLSSEELAQIERHEGFRLVEKNVMVRMTGLTGKERREYIIWPRTEEFLKMVAGRKSVDRSRDVDEAVVHWLAEINRS